MDIKQNLHLKDSKVLRLYRGNQIFKMNTGNSDSFQLIDDFDTINKYFNYKLNTDKEYVVNLSDATKDWVCYNSKWYRKNNQGEYELYGIYEKVSDLASVTTYKGKLVINTTDNHEYKWSGDGWIDLGNYRLLYMVLYYSAQFKLLSKFNKNYKIEVDYIKNDDYEARILSPYGSSGLDHYYGPIEMALYKTTGYYLDYHFPLNNGETNECYHGDFSARYYLRSDNSKLSKNTEYTVRIGWKTLQFYKYGETSPVVEETGGSGDYCVGNCDYSGDWYSGDYEFYTSSLLNSSYATSRDMYVFGYRFYDDNDNLIHYFIYDYDSDSKLIIKDAVTGDIYQNLGYDKAVEPIVKESLFGFPPVLYESIPIVKEKWFSTYNDLFTNINNLENYKGQYVTVNSLLYIFNDKRLKKPENMIYITNVHGHWAKSSTVSKDGYTVIESVDSYNINSEYDLIKVEYFSDKILKFLYGSYGEPCCDYLVIGYEDVDKQNWNSTNFSGGKYSTNNKSSSNAPDFSGNFSKNNHFFYVMYRKDESIHANSDRGYLAFPSDYKIVID